MCGRYAAGRSTDDLIEEMRVETDHVDDAAAPWEPDYNVAPTSPARVVLERAPRGTDGPETSDAHQVRQLRVLRWGLVPSWAKDAKVGARMINARAETLLDKPAYRRAARSRRCLVPADGWYEWQASPVAKDAKGRPRKQPFFMRRADGAGVAFGGLYEFWKDPSPAPDADPWLVTFTIVTTAAEPGLDRIHDRQPLVLDPDRWDAWLDPQQQDAEAVGALLVPSGPGRFEAHPVGRSVGNPRAQGAELVEPVGRAELVGVVDPTTGEIIGG